MECPLPAAAHSLPPRTSLTEFDDSLSLTNPSPVRAEVKASDSNVSEDLLDESGLKI